KVQKVEDGTAPLTVQLEPLAAFTGRVVGADGRPRAGRTVVAQPSRRKEDYAGLPHELFARYAAWHRQLGRQTTTDADGKFRLSDLVPGLKYQLSVTEESALPAYRAAPAAGKVDDLGDLKAG